MLKNKNVDDKKVVYLVVDVKSFDPIFWKFLPNFRTVILASHRRVDRTEVGPAETAGLI